jgi:hypothetical protein
VPTPEDIRARYQRLHQPMPECGWRGCHRPLNWLVEIGDREQGTHRQLASCALHIDAWHAYAQAAGLPIVQTKVDAPEPQHPQPVEPRPPAYEQQTLL